MTQDLVVYTEGEGAHSAAASLAPPPPPPPPAHRPAAEVADELNLQEQWVAGLESRVIPQATKCRDDLAAARGRVQARLDALGARIVVAGTAERERQRQRGQAPQMAFVTPRDGATRGPVTDIDRLLVEAEQLRGELQVAITAHVEQDTHLTYLYRHVELERQKRGVLQTELREVRAAEGAPAPDATAPGGRLHALRQAVSRLGAG